MTRIITWLHITDLHIGSAGLDASWDQLESAFFRDLGEVVARSGSIDYVILSGDATNRGTEAEFTELEARLGRLWKWLASEKFSPTLLVVPGNHDVLRPPLDSIEALAITNLWDKAELQSIFNGNGFQANFKKWFENYSNWLVSTKIPVVRSTDAKMPGDVATRFNRLGRSVGLIGLNTAFLQLRAGEFKGRLALLPSQAKAVCEGNFVEWSELNDINIIVAHHPPSWLSEDSATAFYRDVWSPAERVAVYLCGHLHEPELHDNARGGANSRRVHQGASLFGMETFINAATTTQSRIHGYSVGSIDECVPEGDLTHRFLLRIWPRVVVKKQDRSLAFAPDHSYELGKEECTSSVISTVSNRTNYRSKDARDEPSPWVKQRVEELETMASKHHRVQQIGSRYEYFSVATQLLRKKPKQFRECLVGPLFFHPIWYMERKNRNQPLPPLESVRAKFILERATRNSGKPSPRLFLANRKRYVQKVDEYVDKSERDRFVSEMLLGMDKLWGVNRDRGPQICCVDPGFNRIELIADNHLLTTFRTTPSTPIEGGVLYADAADLDLEIAIFDRIFDATSQGQGKELERLEDFIRNLWQ